MQWDGELRKEAERRNKLRLLAKQIKRTENDKACEERRAEVKMINGQRNRVNNEQRVVKV